MSEPVRLPRGSKGVRTPPLDTRTCRTCSTELPWSLEHWPNRKGKPVGYICKPCTAVALKAQKATYKNPLADHITAEQALAAVPPPVAAPVVARKPDLPTVPCGRPTKSGKMSLQKALSESVDLVNATAEEVMTTLRGYARDPRSPWHEKALFFFAERAAPIRTFGNLADAEAGVSDSSGARVAPVTIIVSGMGPRPGIEVQAAIDVTPLPPALEDLL